MIIQFKGLSYESIVVFDLEHDSHRLLQLACLLFKRVDKDLYRLERNLNFYLKQPDIAPFISRYTNITNEFIASYGVGHMEAFALFRELMKDCKPTTTCFVSHDISQDRSVLKENGFNLEQYNSACTYKLARRILMRDDRLTLTDIAEECAYSAFDKHNAYTDAWATVAVLSYLLNINTEKEIL